MGFSGDCRCRFAGHDFKCPAQTREFLLYYYNGNIDLPGKWNSKFKKHEGINEDETKFMIKSANLFPDKEQMVLDEDKNLTFYIPINQPNA